MRDRVIKIGVTATREGLTPPQAQMLFKHFKRLTPPCELHDGMCVGGDEVAVAQAKVLCWRTVGHPAKVPRDLQCGQRRRDELRAPRPPLARNRDIVDEVEELIALPKGPEELRSGTWATVRYARRVRRPLTIIYPDGTMAVENYAHDAA